MVAEMGFKKKVGVFRVDAIKWHERFCLVTHVISLFVKYFCLQR